MSDAPVFCVSAIAALFAFATFRIKRPHQIADDYSDSDSRTAALAEMLGNGAAAQKGAGGGTFKVQRPFAQCLDRTHDGSATNS